MLTNKGLDPRLGFTATARQSEANTTRANNFTFGLLAPPCVCSSSQPLSNPPPELGNSACKRNVRLPLSNELETFLMNVDIS